MDQQTPSTEELAAPWEAAIVYPDGRAPVLLTSADACLPAVGSFHG